MLPWAGQESQGKVWHYIDPHFEKLGDAMVTWIEAWEEINIPPQAPSEAHHAKTLAFPSQSNIS